MEIAIIAHDGEKADMVQFLNKNSDLLQQESIKLMQLELQEVRLRKLALK
jgi:methylglyoxal synthase